MGLWNINRITKIKKMDVKFIDYFSKYEKIILLIICSIYFNNLFIDIMNVDAAQYASISLEMLHNHSYLQVMDLQKVAVNTTLQ